MRGPSVPLHSNLPNDVSSSEDEEDRLRREEEEQERLLSREHGEANEAPSSRAMNRKRANQQTDAEIADALNSNDKSSSSSSSNASKKRRKGPTLDEKKLTGSTGLIFIRREFPTKIQYKDPKKVLMMLKKKRTKTSSRYSMEVERKNFKRKQFEMEVNASASYLSKLMKAYQNFALELAPNMYYKDTFNRIQDLGSKKQIRDYLNVMREEVCKEHLSKSYGQARAEKLLSELEHGLRSHKEKLLNDTDGFGAEDINADKNANRPLNNMRAARNLGILVESEDPSYDVSTTHQEENDGVSGKEKGAKMQKDYIEKSKSAATNANYSDSEEEEATFDEVTGKTNINNALSGDTDANVTGIDEETADDKQIKERNQISDTKNNAGDESISSIDAGRKSVTTDEKQAGKRVENNRSDEETSNIGTTEDMETMVDKPTVEEMPKDNGTERQRQVLVDVSQMTKGPCLGTSQCSASQLDTQDDLTLDASQKFGETEALAESLTQNSIFEEDSHERRSAGTTSQVYEETETAIASLQPASKPEIIIDPLSQDY